MITVLLAVQPAPIVITGRALEEEPPVATAPVVRVEEEISTLASGRLEEAISGIGGLTFFRRADSRSVHPTSQGLTARGLGGNAASRIVLTIDGVPQADPFGGWINLAAIDAASVDRLSVVRGAAAQPGAVAGSISIDTLARSPREIKVAWGGDDRWDLSSVGHFKIGKGFLQTASGFLESDGFTPIVAEDRGPADRGARTEQRSSRLRFVHPVAGLEAQLGLVYFTDQRDRGFDGSENEADGLDLSLRLVERDGKLPFELTGWWQDRQFETRFAALDEDRATTRIVLDQFDVPSNGYGVEGKLDAGTVHLGAGWRGNDGEVRERFFFVDGYPMRERNAGGRSRTASLFASTIRDMGATRIGMDGRVDFWSLSDGFRTIEQLADGMSLEDSSFRDRDGTEWSGRLGLVRDQDSYQLRAAVHRGWRLPTLNELYRPFRVGADATAANEVLDPETSFGVDVGADMPTGPLTFGGTLFWQRLDDAIANVPLDTGPGRFPGVGFVSGAGTYSQRLNVDGIESRGIELDARGAYRAFDARLSYAFADARLDASGAAAAFDGNDPPQSPRHSGSFALGWSRDDMRLQLTTRLEGSRFDDLANLERLDSAVTFDAFARVPLHEKFALELRGENLADAQIISGFASDGSRERARGRTLWLGLRYRR